jgi:hypothetical protein
MQIAVKISVSLFLLMMDIVTVARRPHLGKLLAPNFIHCKELNANEVIQNSVGSLAYILAVSRGILPTSTRLRR